MKKRVFHGLAFILMAVFAVCCLYPIFWLILNSFKTNKELYYNTCA